MKTTLQTVRSYLTQTPSRYFWIGMRTLVKTHAGFAREIALEQAMNFIKSCHLKGDYMEFGVFQGRTFSAACHLARERALKEMQFWAFDSFEGLPHGGGEFRAGAYACDIESFRKNVRRNIGDLSHVHIVQGWFDKTLVEDHPALTGMQEVAIAWIDCDLYESAVPVLNFLTARVQDGSILFFDDWFNFKGRSDCGEQKACAEWLQRNQQITLAEYSRFGSCGKSFVVQIAREQCQPSFGAKIPAFGRAMATP